MKIFVFVLAVNLEWENYEQRRCQILKGVITWKNRPLASMYESFFGCVTRSRRQYLSLCASFLHFTLVSRTSPQVLPFALHFSTPRSSFAFRAPFLQFALQSNSSRSYLAFYAQLQPGKITSLVPAQPLCRLSRLHCTRE